MNAELTELVFILDRSGSMGGLESDTIGGFNGMIERQKKEGEKVNVTTILFDDEVEIIHDRFPIDAVQPLTDKEYYVRGCTALLDAVGQAINKIDNVQKHLQEEHRAGKVLFVITTDGLENSSTEFNYNDIKRMIEAKKECGWEFLFLGANIDAGKEAEKIGGIAFMPIIVFKTKEFNTNRGEANKRDYIEFIKLLGFKKEEKEGKTIYFKSFGSTDVYSCYIEI